MYAIRSYYDYGFRFRQEFRYSDRSHRVTALNRLKAPLANLLETVCPGAPVPPPDGDRALATWVAHCGELQAGYLFLPLAEAAARAEVEERLARTHGVSGAGRQGRAVVHHSYNFV